MKKTAPFYESLTLYPVAEFSRPIQPDILAGCQQKFLSWVSVSIHLSTTKDIKVQSINRRFFPKLLISIYFYTILVIRTEKDNRLPKKTKIVSQ